MRLLNEPIFTNADASMTQTSPTFTVNQIYGWSAQFEFTGSPAGTLKVQTSNDPGSSAPGDAQASSVINWSDLQDSSITITGAGTPGYNYNGSFYNWVRFVYTPSGGTGTLTGRMNGKGN